MPLCHAEKPDGRPCQARAQGGSNFCYFHDPETSEDRYQAQRRGGSKRGPLRVISSPHCDFDLSQPAEIAKLLTYAANRVVRGELDAKAAYALGYLSDCAIRARTAGVLSDRIDHLERLQRAEGTGSLPFARSFESRFEEEDAADSVEQEANGGTGN